MLGAPAAVVELDLRGDMLKRMAHQDTCAGAW
jgi:uncharacterized protein YjiK